MKRFEILMKHSEIIRAAIVWQELGEQRAALAMH